jgi:hypothetical protein
MASDSDKCLSRSMARRVLSSLKGILREAQRQGQLAHALVGEAGIDLVYGHSCHHPKGAEVYRDKLILYGCGDFINDYEGIRGHEEFRGDLVLAYLATCSIPGGELRSLTLLPFKIEKFRLNSASAQDAAWLRGVLDRESAKLGTRLAATGGRSLKLLWRSVHNIERCHSNPPGRKTGWTPRVPLRAREDACRSG